MKYAEREWRGKAYQTRMKALCEGLAELGAWTRLHYVYPYPHVDDIIPLMAEGKLLPYLDIPFQHASPRILKLMKRPGAVDKTLERIQRWRAICPDLTIRSTFIVGFPGETEAEFEELLDFLDEAQLDRVGAFAYSPVDGAAANALPDPVPEEVKQERLARFMERQARDQRRAARGQGRHACSGAGRRDRRRTRDRALEGRCAGDRRPGADPGRRARPACSPGEFVDVRDHGQRRARPVRRGAGRAGLKAGGSAGCAPKRHSRECGLALNRRSRISRGANVGGATSLGSRLRGNDGLGYIRVRFPTPNPESRIPNPRFTPVCRPLGSTVPPHGAEPWPRPSPARPLPSSPPTASSSPNSTEPRRLLEEAGASVDVIAPKAGSIRGWDKKDWGKEVAVDKALSDVEAGSYDALVLPGGVINPDKLRMDKDAVGFIKACFDGGKPVAAICHGPWTLIEADLVEGRNVTSWPSLRKDLENAGATWEDSEVVEDGGLITSRKPDDIPAFTNAVIRAVAG